MFFNRRQELDDLERLWKGDRANFIIVYGRRRVGKSSLLRVFGQNKPVFYWTATKTTNKRLLESFSKELQAFKNPKSVVPDEFSYPNWESALLELANISMEKRILAVIDEFPYAIDAEPELPSLLQKLWDNNFSRSKIDLCVTGSRIGMIEKHVLSSNGPLYGRANAVIWLDPLPPNIMREFLPQYSQSQLVEVYSITGGVPLYIEMFDGRVPVLENLKRALTSTTSILKGEPYFLIHEELKEPMRYVAILEAMGGGKSSQSEIARSIGIDKTHIVPYLHTLEGLKFIKRIVPVTENPKNSRKGIYIITDLFLKFYFRFIAPNINLIEERREEKVVDIIAANLDSFVGRAGFEDICRQWMIKEAKKSNLPFDPELIGKYWDSACEVDVAAISKKHKSLIIGEAKWTGKQCDIQTLAELNQKADYLAKNFGYHVNKMIFGKSGFSDGLTSRAKIENVRLVGLDELMS